MMVTLFERVSAFWERLTDLGFEIFEFGGGTRAALFDTHDYWRQKNVPWNQVEQRERHAASPLPFFA